MKGLWLALVASRSVKIGFGIASSPGGSESEKCANLRPFLNWWRFPQVRGLDERTVRSQLWQNETYARFGGDPLEMNKEQRLGRKEKFEEKNVVKRIFFSKFRSLDSETNLMKNCSGLGLRKLFFFIFGIFFSVFLFPNLFWIEKNLPKWKKKSRIASKIAKKKELSDEIFKSDPSRDPWIDQKKLGDKA